LRDFYSLNCFNILNGMYDSWEWPFVLVNSDMKIVMLVLSRQY